jgi:CRP/FNR family transcriptional regulator, cyclic AMP receptor protein
VRGDPQEQGRTATRRQAAVRPRTRRGLGTGDGPTRSLAQVDVLEPLSEGELEDLAARCQNIHLERGEERPCPEEYDGGLLLVMEGRVRVYRLIPRGRQVTFALLGGGRAFPVPESQVLYIQAVEPSTIALVRREVLEGLVREEPDMAMRLMTLLAEFLCRIEEQVCDMIHKDVPSRLASAIMRLVEDDGIVTREGCKIPTHYTHDQLSTMIGANRVAVTKAFSTLQDLGAVELKRRLIYVPDVEALRRFASEERELARNGESTDEGDSRQRSSA